MPRGRGRGGRQNFRQNANRNDGRMSIHDRLSVGGNSQRTNKISNTSKLTTTKFVRRSAQSDTCGRRPISLSCATLPDVSKVKALVKKIVREYYVIFDTQGRSNIEHAYHDEAFYSMTDIFQRDLNTPILPTAQAMDGSRNLLETRDPHNRLAKLRCGKASIAHALALFPHTEHLVDTFNKDVPFFTMNTLSVSSLQIVITGLFKDLSQPGLASLKAFTRIFVLKQTGFDEEGEARYAIFNDLFMIQTPSADQTKKHCEIMIQSIMQKTRMKHSYSNQLLAEHHWQEEAALTTFRSLMQENKIPTECFRPGANS